MFVELHILQNFAPSNLNRDDTGAPKDCEFGGYRRARVSSQSWKRAMRTAFGAQGLLPPARLSARTKRLVEELAARFVERGNPEAEARQAAEAAVQGIGFGLETTGKTKYLLFVAADEIDAVVDVCLDHWDELRATGALRLSAGGGTTGPLGREELPADLQAKLQSRLDGGRAVDLALFGRMVANLPEKNVDGACQVAHAISTHRVSTEFDFYTAVDDLRPDDTKGADMLGTVEFNSACFYRYLNVDIRQLTANLREDAELARTAVVAFLQAAVTAVPSGKQHSMAAQNPPSLVFAVVRTAGLWSLANAFVRPVVPDRDGDLVANSIRALDRYWGALADMYGADGLVEHAVCTLAPDALDRLAPARVPTVAELLRRVDAAVAGLQAGGTAP